MRSHDDDDDDNDVDDDEFNDYIYNNIVIIFNNNKILKGHCYAYLSSQYVNFMSILCLVRKALQSRGISMLEGCGMGLAMITRHGMGGILNPPTTGSDKASFM